MIGSYRVFANPILSRWRWTGPVAAREMLCFSEQAREAFNDWALGLFGGKKEGQIIVSEVQGAIFAHPAVVAELERTIGRAK